MLFIRFLIHYYTKQRQNKAHWSLALSISEAIGVNQKDLSLPIIGAPTRIRAIKKLLDKQDAFDTGIGTDVCAYSTLKESISYGCSGR